VLQPPALGEQGVARGENLILQTVRLVSDEERAMLMQSLKVFFIVLC
jgi:hypothetical protein